VIGNLEGNKSVERLMHLRGDYIINGVTGKEWEGADWINLTQDRDQWLTPVSTKMNLQVS
jgi:hypothetical protein